MSQKAGIWEYDPDSDRMSWHFPDGVSFEALTRQERDRVLEILRAARDMNGSGVVVEVLRVGEPGEGCCWIALYGRRVLKAWTATKIVGVVVDVSEQKRQAEARETVIAELRSCVRTQWAADEAGSAQGRRAAGARI